MDAEFSLISVYPGGATGAEEPPAAAGGGGAEELEDEEAALDIDIWKVRTVTSRVEGRREEAASGEMSRLSVVDTVAAA